MSGDETTRDRILRGRGSLVGTVQILAASGWERGEIVRELDKVYDATTPERTYLVGRFDVTELKECERERLGREVAHAAEASYSDEWGCGHPYVDCMVTLETVPETTREP